jgi:hypothetical protein
MGRLAGMLGVFLLIAMVPAAQASSYYCAQFRGYGLANRLERPTVPNCLTYLGISNDEYAFDMCRNDLERYRSSMRDYLKCLNSEADEAIDELNKSISKFNCYARNESICF